jgi:hypothetical protein
MVQIAQFSWCCATRNNAKGVRYSTVWGESECAYIQFLLGISSRIVQPGTIKLRHAVS